MVRPRRGRLVTPRLFNTPEYYARAPGGGALEVPEKDRYALFKA